MSRRVTRVGADGGTRRSLLRAVGGATVAGASVGTAVDTAAAQTDPELRQTARLEPPEDEAAEFGLFGLSTDVDGDRIVVGAPHQDERAEDAGAAYLFVADGEDWTLQRRFDAGDDASPGARFGQAVALDGDSLLVGASNDPEVGRDAGAVYAFERIDGEWERTQKLLPTSYDEGWDIKPTFGWRVAMEGDRAVVAVPGNSDFDTANGLVGVLERGSDGTWERVDTLYPQESPATYPFFLVEFGQGLALSGDRILVGAPGDGEAAPEAGAAYVFERTGEGWEPTQKLLEDPARPNARFGYAVALSGDRSLVGAPFHVETPTSESHGAVSMYAAAGDEWEREARFSMADTQEPPGGWFGYAVALEGDRALVTRPNARGDEETDSGEAFVFGREEGNWTQRQRLTAGDPENAVLFGFTTALSEGRTVVTDSWYNGPADQSGAAYVFDRAGTTGGDGPGFGPLGVLAAAGLLGLRALAGGTGEQDTLPPEE